MAKKIRAAAASWGPTALGVLALAALLWSGYQCVTLGRAGQVLQTDAAPRGGLSLQMAATTAEADAIRRNWAVRGLVPVAQASLARDTRFIASYVLAGVLLAIWAAWAGGVSVALTATLVSLIAAAGLWDLAENWLLAITLGNPDQMPFARIAALFPAFDAYARLPDQDYRHAVTLARLAAMSKFALLLVGVAGTLATAAGTLRAILVRRIAASAGRTPRSGFRDLIARENDGIFTDHARRRPDTPAYDDHPDADEPRVLFRAADLIGLALSGGGIRSATFNLGLLQGLHRLRLLHLFDYVSTVSGGGYVGSFWSEWLARRPGGPIAEATLFPTHRDSGGQPQSTVDSPQERHLREFSRFLAPRLGFFEIEAWTAVVAVVAGLVPALIVGLSVIGAGLIGWLALTFCLASGSSAAAALVIGGVTLVVLRIFESLWQRFKHESAGRASGATGEEAKAGAQGRAWYWLTALVSVGLVAAIQFVIPDIYQATGSGPWPVYHRGATPPWMQASATSGLLRWWVITGIDNPGHPWIFSPRLFDFGLTWLATALMLVLARVTSAVWLTTWKKPTLAAYDRVLLRVLALGVFWTGVTLLWHVSINLQQALAAAAAAAVASGGLFATLRNWIGTALRRPSEAGRLDRLKPYLPQVLAYVTLTLTIAVTGGVLIQAGGTDWLAWWMTAAVISGWLVLALFIKPDEFGLHAFYRDRISRAYAGACNLAEGATAATNRGTEPRARDDRPLVELRSRPLHLVCCAANDLSGDQVETLGRGARSAVLSRHGFSLGSHFQPWTATTSPLLGSAITASAAAFNSNMGQISVRVGPAVSFLMTMLNLRLGLWLRHPAASAAGPRRWPGLLYYREMFGLTSASGRIPAEGLPSRYLRDVHLSDGGHFENLALYELVRRHCRYVLVSDCGADPTVAFDDLGNALRRVREDFGVDISLDVSVLRPGPDGLARQHVAVGTIHYSPTDRGILLYVKPSMTGDEPTDVRQYQTRNTAFPHESTGDQFYDEAQWESYRRLGLHAAECVFDFAVRDDGAQARTADWVFAEASHHWGATPEGLEASVLEMTKRFGVLESELHQRAARGILADIFPEMAYVDAGLDSPPEPVETPREGSVDILPFLLRVTQLMEDVWLTCQLDQWWSHPLNMGWINLFARWATSPPFRFWWPMLAPMFSAGFRRFIEDRFPMPPGDAGSVQVPPTPQRGRVERLASPRGSGLAAVWWEERATQPTNWALYDEAEYSRQFYAHVVDLTRPHQPPVPMQVGLVAVTRRGAHAGWTSEEFFVPPSLWGTGMGWYLLTGLLDELAQSGVEWCQAIVKAPPAGARHQVARDDQRAFIEQYRKIGFREQRGGDHGADVDAALGRRLGISEAEDTWLVLDLSQWAGRRSGSPP